MVYIISCAYYFVKLVLCSGFMYFVGLSNICYSEDKKSSSIWFGVFQPSGLIGKRL